MSNSFRTTNSNGLINKDKKINFTFNGTIYHGYEGDTLASALIVNGVHLVGRSFKYHRPRGFLGVGVEEPNAMVQLHDGNKSEPNIIATEVELVVLKLLDIKVLVHFTSVKNFMCSGVS